MSLADKKRPALGRGMAALFGNAAAAGTNAAVATGPSRAVMMLPIEAVERAGRQPRKRFDEARLAELAASIAEHGILEPILVRKDGARFRIVAGERRWRAAQRAGLKEIPALLKDASDQDAFLLALVENLQRDDLNAIEEAMGYQFLADHHALTQEQIAAQVGKERSTVANALRLLKLPADVREAVMGGELEMGHARALLALDDKEAIGRAAGRVMRERLSVRATESLVRELKGGKKKSREKGEGSAALRELTHRLQRRLGAKCRVVARGAASGRIEIAYGSLDELDAILSRMGA